jgi:hypothetical protein
VPRPGRLPANLPGATAVPRPEPVEAPRGFFEAARPANPPPPARPASITGSVEPPPSASYSDSGGVSSAPDHQSGARPISGWADDAGEDAARADHAMPEAASAKLEQLKDLYLTAEAIGEDALDKHFDQVSQRQRQLIREFFERSGGS